MNDSNIKQALTALREASADLHASDEMEGKLRQAFQARHLAKPKVGKRYGWIAGTIAASLLTAALAMRLTKTASVNAPAPPAVAKKEVVKPQPTPVPRRALPAVARRSRQKTPLKRVPQQREVATDFFAIPYAPAMTQFDQGQVIRVKVPASSMRSFGLPVREERIFDRIDADVLLGGDGIARAIRFVR
jgi:hypothetical protein